MRYSSDAEVRVHRQREPRLIRFRAVRDLEETIAESRISPVVKNVVLAVGFDFPVQEFFRWEREAFFARPYDEEVSFKLKAVAEWKFASSFKRSICCCAKSDVGKD